MVELKIEEDKKILEQDLYEITWKVRDIYLHTAKSEKDHVTVDTEQDMHYNQENREVSEQVTIKTVLCSSLSIGTV